MDWRSFPSLNTLRAFAVVAETGSLSKAGDVLNVTHAAVSQQIRNLETRLGVPLVRREGRGGRPHRPRPDHCHSAAPRL